MTFMGAVLYRFAIDHLETWFDEHPRKPLVMRGARQVGKSTLVKLFAQKRGLRIHEVNLERHLYLEEIFRSQDLHAILGELQGLTGEISDSEPSLLFLDEIQAIPSAIQSLRYFYEDKPELPVIAAGSLLEFAQADSSFSMPVGRITYYHMTPMSFGEYLHAIDPDLYAFYDAYSNTAPIPETYHQRLTLRQREYLFVGGMPEAVQRFVDTQSFEKVQEVHRSILETYIDDFAKYARKSELARLQKVFRALPLVQGKKIKYSSLSIDDKAADIKSAIDLLSKARICVKVFHTSCSGLPLGAERDENTFKLLFLDVGLLNFQLGLSWQAIRRMDERTLVNEGSLAEQFVGQELIASQKAKAPLELYYWLREGKRNNAEVDFLLTSEARIIPVEVKAGKSGSLKSLHQFLFLKQGSFALRFDMNKSSTQNPIIRMVDAEGLGHDLAFTILSLPLYFAGKALAFLKET